LTLLIVSMLLLAACEGPAGPPGEAGNNGIDGIEAPPPPDINGFISAALNSKTESGGDVARNP
jgi:hypothetical protein